VTTVADIEPLRDTVRVYLADPVPLTVDITPDAARELDLHADSPIWATVKATEVDVAEQ
jgi:molybdopterin-binding protein